MKKLFVITLLGVLVTGTGFTPDVRDNKSLPDLENHKFRRIDNKAFKPGEKLTYRLHYGIIDAGEAVLEVQESKQTISGRKLLHMVGTGRSKGTFDFFFKVRDKYETYMDAEGVFPWMFIRRVNEGGYKINQNYKFYQHKNKVDNGQGKEFDTPANIQDMLSAFYFARTIDFSKAKKGDIFTVTTFVDNEIFPLKIKYAGIDKLKLGKKTYSCLKFHPVVQKGRIFKAEEDLSVWISNDRNKVPMMAKAKILVGSIKMELTEYQGLAGPIAEIE